MRQAGATPHRGAGTALHRGARAFHYRGPSRCGAQAPDAQAQQLWLTGPAAPRHVGSSQTRARTRVPCISRQILNHCATREALDSCLICVLACFSLNLSCLGLSVLPGLDYFLSRIREFFKYNLFKYFLRHFLFLFFFWDPVL